MYDTAFTNTSIKHFHNAKPMCAATGLRRSGEIMSPVAITQAVNEIQQWSAYAPTPLRHFDGLATQLGIAAVYYKDESTRFGLGSFKALGGAYAVLCLLQQTLSKPLAAKSALRKSAMAASPIKHRRSPWPPPPTATTGVQWHGARSYLVAAV